ncbi:hypothetical protein ACFX13_022157 [Malus domestica]
MSPLLWRVKVDSYREFLNTCRGDDAAENDWRLFDIWDWRFDKLPVISAKLSLRVMGATRLEKQDASPISELASSIFEWPL